MFPVPPCHRLAIPAANRWQDPGHTMAPYPCRPPGQDQKRARRRPLRRRTPLCSATTSATTTRLARIGDVSLLAHRLAMSDGAPGAHPPALHPRRRHPRVRPGGLTRHHLGSRAACPTRRPSTTNLWLGPSFACLRQVIHRRDLPSARAIGCHHIWIASKRQQATASSTERSGGDADRSRRRGAPPTGSAPGQEAFCHG